MFLHQILPPSLMIYPDLAGVGPRNIQRYYNEKVESAESPKKSAGLFSTFTSFLLAAADEMEFEAEVELFDEPRLITCIRHCRVEELLIDTTFMEVETLKRFLGYIIGASIQVNESGSEFTSSSVFIIEVLIRILVHNRDRIDCLWGLVWPHFLDIFTRDDVNSSLLVVAMSGIMRLILRVIHMVDDI